MNGSCWSEQLLLWHSDWVQGRARIVSNKQIHLLARSGFETGSTTLWIFVKPWHPKVILLLDISFASCTAHHWGLVTVVWPLSLFYLSPCAHGQDESFNKLEIISKYDSANKKMKSFDATSSIRSIWVCSTHQPISDLPVALNAPVPVWTLIFTRENQDTWVLPILKAWVQLSALLRSEWTWSNASDVSHTWLSRISSLRVV